MLTRLKVSGFKNLVDVDVRFGPFTCIAGANGVGKSNLFDAIHFLSALANGDSFVKAAMSIRGEDGSSTDIRSLFHRVGDHLDDEMSFEAEMIIPHEAEDDLGQITKASATVLRYSVKLAFRVADYSRSTSGLELLKEELVSIKPRDAAKCLFPHSLKWRKSALIGGQKVTHFIATIDEKTDSFIVKHQEGRPSGGYVVYTEKLPRTVLSVSNTADSPTAVLAKREMQSWRTLQFEPSAMRKPDAFGIASGLTAEGSNLAATLYGLAHSQVSGLSNGNGDDAGAADHAVRVYAEVGNLLAELVNDVRDVWVDRDEERQLFTLRIRGRDGTVHSSRSLSEGTLRFLALAILQADYKAQGLICLEEPENGIHPDRISAMLRMLRNMVTDVGEPIEVDNPLRQVIVNTHSPSVVLQVPDDSLIVAENVQRMREGRRFSSVTFRGLSGTWRDNGEKWSAAPPGSLLGILNPPAPKGQSGDADEFVDQPRVVDREDLQWLLPHGAAE